MACEQSANANGRRYGNLLLPAYVPMVRPPIRERGGPLGNGGAT